MSLADELRARIERDGPMRVRDFMAEALRTYYGSGPEIGARGDFYTASNVSLFPHALRRFVDSAKERLEGARVVELGGGRGELAAHLAPDTIVVEPHAGLAEAQRARGLRVVAWLAELKPAPTVFIANEVLDALPVHRVLRIGDALHEGHVDNRNGGFVEVPGPLSPELADVDLQLEPGQAAEVCLDARDLLAEMAAAAPRSIALFVDYASSGPQEGGTLRGFHQHRVTDAFDRPGEQDITADVDFDAIARLARDGGYDVLGQRAQGEFLADLGLVDDMMGALARGDTDAYMAAKGLLMPTAMGERFRALCIGRGIATTPPLAGFRADTYPGPSRR